MSQRVPKIEESTKFNLFTSIWIVPLIALFVAAWLAYQYFSELGPEIRIVFPKNEGLKAGQSHIKYRDVPIGVVKKIELEEEGNGVTVVVRMNAKTSSYLNENTKFWIVKPEVGMSGVSGLDTLISGTYINMFTQSGTESKDMFSGLTNAFRKTSEGEYIQLSAPTGHNIRVGTPIYFKDMKAGQVEYMNISLDSTSIEFIVFVEKFYVPYVHTSSKFWVQSVLDIDMTGGKVDVNVAPFTNLIQGGISFSSSGEDMMDTVPEGFVFNLHKNSAVTQANNIGDGIESNVEFAIIVENSVSQLNKEAPVRYDGFDVGNVKDIKLSYDKKSHKMIGKVLVQIDTSIFKDEKENNTSGEENFYAAVKEGLKAQFKSMNPISGSLFVDLVFEESNVTEALAYLGEYPLLPSVKQVEAGVMDGVDNIINNLSAMTDNKSFSSMPNEIENSLKELTKTLKITKKVVKSYGSTSLMSQQLAQTLKVVSRTSQEMREFLKMLNRKPNSLIFGD
jgi:paraquat-inducible protein B